MSKDKVSFHCLLPREQVACFLESLAQGIRNGCLRLEGNDGRGISLAASPVFDIEAKAKIKENRAKVELELEWTTAGPGLMEP